jgi:1-deoxy-D-xylulose-5-phosphate reductoisomerase
MTKSVTILGATGSIGTSTLDIIRHHHDKFKITALSANSNVQMLADLAKEFNAEVAAIADDALYADLVQALAGSRVKAVSGEAGLKEAANASADITVSAIVGAAGLRPTLEAIRQGGTIILANKECLVCAGELFHREVEASGATLLPADSEHNAIFQVFDEERADAVERIILTASGGPFLHTSVSELVAVTPAQAVAHPNWDMGAKISVDSATMMNKGLEVIEAYYLFPIEKSKIDVVIHPQSIIHSMVEYIDGSILAQMGAPDMRTPLAYCLGWPERIESNGQRLDFSTMNDLSFHSPDLEKFRCLGLAYQSLNEGGSAPTVLNAANEIAVDGFLKGKIGFLDIASVVETVLNNNDMKSPHSISSVFEIDRTARELATKVVNNLCA